MLCRAWWRTLLLRSLRQGPATLCLLTPSLGTTRSTCVLPVPIPHPNTLPAQALRTACAVLFRNQERPTQQWVPWLMHKA